MTPEELAAAMEPDGGLTLDDWRAIQAHLRRLALLERERDVLAADLMGWRKENARLRSASEHAVEILITGKPTRQALEAVRILESRRYLVGEHGVLAQSLADEARRGASGGAE